ncbi:MAG: DUF4386 domain-containing protein [Blastomonas sp.]|uniref:DUF4386 domain-containing protein n=1 Tax=Blastomonas sp. TaxID=1909299 RepID=UPI00406A23D9|nr:DUF4386 domain-containing protein [Blastomonas sp.]
MMTDAQHARLAGLTYLGTIVCGVYAEVLVRGALFVRGDAVATAQAVFASETLFRFGLIADLAMLACYIVVTILLYGLFRKGSPYLRATAAAFSLIGIAVLACDTLLLAMVLRLPDLAQPSSSLSGTAYLLLRVHGDGYKISLVFFGAYCLLLSWLIWRERIIPIAVGVMVAAAGACNVINSLAWLGAPQWAVRLPQYFTMPTLLGELALALWLLIFGIREVEA